MSVSSMTYTLKTPTYLDAKGMYLVEQITLRAPLAGDALRARGVISNDKRLGVVLINDQLTLASTMLKTILASTTPPVPTPLLLPHWPELFQINDLSALVNMVQAMSTGFDSVEAYEAQVKARIARMRELTDQGVTQQLAAEQAEKEFPDANEVSGDAGRALARGVPDGERVEGGTGERPAPDPAGI